jgi:hypothetical protein
MVDHGDGISASVTWSLTMIGPNRLIGMVLTAVFPFVVMGCKPSAQEPHTLPGQTNQIGDVSMSLTIRSAAFDHNGSIPTRYTGDGEDLSPPLTWSDLPENARELALIMDDPDAPTPEPWVHWVIYKIPATATTLPENVPAPATVSEPAGAVQGKNSWGNIGYGGPAPPRGPVHHYHFKLFALDAALEASSGLTKTQLLSAMEGHVLAWGELVGTYQR